MGLLDLIEKHHCIGLSADCLGQLAALIVAHIARRRSDESGYGEFLHILTHIDTDHGILIVKQGFCQGLGQLRLADAGGAEEQEASDGFGRILDAGFRPDDGLRHLFHRLVLADDSLVKRIIQVQGLLPLALVQLRYRNAGPLGDNPGNLVLGHALVHEVQILVLNLLLFLRQLPLQLRQTSVLELRRLVQVVGLLGGLNLAIDFLYLLTELRQVGDAGLLILPLGLVRRELVV